MVRRITQAVEHHQRIRHRRKDAAGPILAVEPLGDEVDGLFDRAPVRIRREHRLGQPQHPVEQGKGMTDRGGVRR